MWIVFDEVEIEFDLFFVMDGNWCYICYVELRIVDGVCFVCMIMMKDFFVVVNVEEGIWIVVLGDWISMLLGRFELNFKMIVDGNLYL